MLGIRTLPNGEKYDENNSKYDGTRETMERPAPSERKNSYLESSSGSSSNPVSPTARDGRKSIGDRSESLKSSNSNPISTSTSADSPFDSPPQENSERKLSSSSEKKLSSSGSNETKAAGTDWMKHCMIDSNIFFAEPVPSSVIGRGLKTKPTLNKAIEDIKRKNLGGKK